MNPFTADINTDHLCEACYRDWRGASECPTCGHVDVEGAIARTLCDLHAAGNWTRVYTLDFPQAQYPVARIEYGSILSDGSQERMIGTASVFPDGNVVVSHHL